MNQNRDGERHSDPQTPRSSPGEHHQAGGASGQNSRQAGDTRRSDQNNEHKGGANGTGGPGGTGGSVL